MSDIDRAVNALKWVRACRNVFTALWLVLQFGSPILARALGSYGGIFVMLGFINGVLIMLAIYWSTKGRTS